MQGIQGEQGITGTTGLQGVQGAPGPAGVLKGSYDGLSGISGAHPTGADGDMYVDNLSGDVYVWNSTTNSWDDAGHIQGPTGPQGNPGPQGPAGVTGPQGITGVQGSTGTTGATGADSTVPGPKGDTGATGAQGSTGATGPQGTQGVQGIQGPTGPTATNAAARLITNSTTWNNVNYTAGSTDAQTVTCPDGYVATGGGGRVTDANGKVLTGAAMNVSRPDPVPPDTPTGWRVGFYFPDAQSNISYQIFVTCFPTT